METLYTNNPLSTLTIDSQFYMGDVFAEETSQQSSKKYLLINKIEKCVKYVTFLIFNLLNCIMLATDKRPLYYKQLGTIHLVHTFC